MPSRCVVFACSETTKHVGISMHGFPRDRAIRLQWEKFVKTNRKDFKNATRHSNICSKHFHEDCFEIPFSPQMLSSGYHARHRLLKSTAVPTIFRVEKVQTSIRKRKTSVKRNQKSIVGDILKDNTDQNISFDLSEPNYMGSGATNCIPPEESESFRTNKKPSVRTIGIQVGTPQIDVFDCVEMASACDSDSSSDQSWAPEEVDSLRADSDEDCSIFQKKYVVDAVSLSDMLHLVNCKECQSNNIEVQMLCTVGTMAIFKLSCNKCNWCYKWKTQQERANYSEGNLSLSAAILFSGALPAQVLKLLKFWGVVAYCRKTFFDHQKNLLIPAIEKVWAQEETLQLSRLTECESIFIAGDGRCDSPGYNAKYLSYTLMNCTSKEILTTQLIQKTETATNSSNSMELLGFKRAFNFIHQKLPQPSQVALVTDGHMSIAKFVREDKPDVTHYLDIWHVAKGLKKKLLKLSTNKGNERIKPWINSIIRHLYWCATTSHGNGDLVLAKWEGVVNHICNIHIHANPLFPQCLHGPLDKDWLMPGTEPFERLSDLIQANYFLKAIQRLSPNVQTASLEGYHSLLTHFAPKRHHFMYPAMMARVKLSALHHNENANKLQAKTKKGGATRFKINFPKSKSGGHTVQPVKAESTYNYVRVLCEEVIKIADRAKIENTVQNGIPRSLASLCNRPNKEEAIAQHLSRYNIKT